MLPLIYFVIPSIFLLFGAVSKRIVRASHSQWSDWFLGLELVLAGMATGIMHGLDLGIKLNRIVEKGGQTIPIALAQEFISVMLFIFASIVLFFVVVIAHQKWERVPETTRSFRTKSIQ